MATKSTSHKTYCSVYGCLNNNLSNPELSFFTLPTKEERHLKWLQLISREDLLTKNPLHYSVCEMHFNTQDVLIRAVRKILKKNCFPSQNLPNLTKEDVKTSDVSTQTEQNTTAVLDLTTSISINTSDNIVQTAASLSEDTPRKRKLLLGCKKQITSGASEASSYGSTLSKKKRKFYSDSDDDDNDSDIEDIEDSEDEYATWANEWALELRQMDAKQLIFAKRAITYVLMEGRLGLLNENSVLVNNKVTDEQPTQNDLNDAPLYEFLVLHNRNPKESSAAVVPEGSTVSEEIAAPTDSKSSLVDTGTGSVTLSHKPTECSSRVKTKTTGKARVSRSENFSRKTATANSGPSFNNDESSFMVISHKTPIPFSSSSSSLVKTEPSEGPGSSPTDGSSSIIIKEPLDSTEGTSYEIQDPLFLTVEPCSNTGPPLSSASHGSATAVRSPTLVKSELNSPPSSPEFTVVVKNEPE